MIKGLFLSVLIVVTSMVAAQPSQSWDSWLKELRVEAKAHGITDTTFDMAFKGVKPNKRVNHFAKTQPEKRLTFLKYRKTRIDPYRITLGVREYKKHRQTLDNIGEQYGVDPHFITAIWGIETSYGRYMGDFPVIGSLATLAYDSDRTKFFRKELLVALKIVQDGHVDLEHFKGEWAGASGHSQFLPSSWKKFAVDYDGDGHKDIWNDLQDVFASIANYLLQNGWKVNEPWAYEAQLPPNFNYGLIGFDQKHSVATWRQAGLILPHGVQWPSDNIQASLIEQYGGPYMLVFDNFRVLLRYNNSKFYAGSVGYLADSIRHKAG